MTHTDQNVSSYGYCATALVPVRAEPSHKSEMTTQLLFGETYAIYETIPGWAKIISVFDHYEGWIDQKQVRNMSEAAFMQFNNLYGIAHEIYFPLNNNTNFEEFFIPIGSSLPGITAQLFRIDDTEYAYNGTYLDPGVQLTGEEICGLAMKFLHSPYLWGGRTHLGIDCSGLAQLTYKLAGYRLPRDSNVQAREGVTINFLSEAEPADLIFFDNEEGDIDHVGILLPENQIIHASGQVRIDRIDHQGIFNLDKNDYTHQLRVVKRVIGYKL